MTPDADGSPNGSISTKTRCPQCGSLNYPSDPFCLSCGKEREPATVTHLPGGPMQVPGQSQRERSRPPSATLILLLGGLSLLLGHYWILGLLLGPVAWVLGNRALVALGVGEASPAEKRQIQIGRICGMISTGFLALLLAVLAPILGLSFLLGGSSTPSVPKNAPAPPIRLADLSGREQTLDDYRGRVVLLNFSASW